MKLWVSIGLVVVASLSSCYAQLFYGTPSFQMNGASQLVLTNEDTNIWFLTSIAGVSSNNAPMSGSFEFWHQRGNYSNKLFMFEYTDVTNFVWYPENNVRIGRNDSVIFKGTQTNVLFLLLGQEK